MVALLVAIAVVFVSSLFFQSSLTFTFTFTYPPPLPSHSHTYIHKLTSHTDYLSLLSDCSGQCSDGFTALKKRGRRRFSRDWGSENG